MANSDHTATRNDIVKGALRRLGNSNPSTEDISNAVVSLNDLVRLIDYDGRWLWAIDNAETQLNIVAGTRTYTFTSGSNEPPAGIAGNILTLETFFLERSPSQRIRIEIWGKTQSLNSRLLEKTGEVRAVYLESGTTFPTNKIHAFPTSSRNETAKYSYRRALFDFDNPNDNPDFPQGAIRPLKIILAADLSDEFGKPLQERQVLELRATEARKDLREMMEENKTIQPAVSEYF